MEIREEIIIGEARRPKLEIAIPETEGDDILTLHLKGRLTPKVAAILLCDYVYDDNGSPHDGFKDANLAMTLADMDLKLTGGDGVEIDHFYPEQIFGFRIYRVNDAALGIQFKAKTSGRLQEILDFFRANRGDGFTISIKPRQGELFGGGTRVAMGESAADPMTGVVDAVLDGIVAASADDPAPTEEAVPADDAPVEEAGPEPVNRPLLSHQSKRRGRPKKDQSPVADEKGDEGDDAPWE